jgi:hypothetical protein
MLTVISEQTTQLHQSLEQLMGNGIDAAKIVSTPTLFEAAELESVCALLDWIWQHCALTLEQLG